MSEPVETTLCCAGLLLVKSGQLRYRSIMAQSAPVANYTNALMDKVFILILN